MSTKLAQRGFFMPTISRNPSGKYRVQIRRTGLPAVSKTFTSKELAEAWARKTEFELDAGMHQLKQETQKVTFNELVDKYINEVSIKKKGYKQEVYRLKKIKDKFNGFRINQIQSKHIAVFRDNLIKEGKVASSILNELSLVSQIFEMAIKEWGIHLPSNPCRAIKKPRVNNPRTRRLNPNEEHALMTYAKASRAPLLPHLISIAIETGMRLGELLSLDWKYVYLDRKYVFLPDTKNGTSRSVPLSSKAIIEFSKIPKHPINTRVFWTWSHNKCIENVWQRICRKAGIEDLHFHDLRHEATTRMAAKLNNILELSAVTGHKDLKMLKRYYHPNPEELALKLG